MHFPLPANLSIRSRPYRRAFARPLLTAHGAWSVREGWLLRLELDGKTAFGEIAPIPWLGSESFQVAASALAAIASGAPLSSIDFSDKPALLSGLSMALLSLERPTPTSVSAPVALLLDRSCLLDPTPPLPQIPSGTTVKLKLLPDDPILPLLSLLQSHPLTRFRLDANGSLTPTQATAFLEALSPLPNFDYLEQPLPPADTPALASLTHRFPHKVALDESVTGLASLASIHKSIPSAILILKPLLVGDWRALLAWRQSHGQDAAIVVSSAMETYPSRMACAWLGATIHSITPHGLGVSQFFADELTLKYQTELDALWPCPDNYTSLWETLGQFG